MAIFIKRTTNARIYEAADEKDCLFAKPDNRAVVSISTLQRYTSGKFSIAASGSESLALGDIDSARGIYIEFDAAAQIQLNGGADTLDVQPETSAQSSAVFFWTGPVTSVDVINPSATAVLTGTYAVWGDATS